MRVKSIIQNGGLFIAAASVTYGVQQFAKDCSDAQKIKSELSDYESIPNDPYYIKIKVMDAEYKEPLFNKTAYWEVEAQKIREQADKKRTSYEKLHTETPVSKNLREILINNLANSFELRHFLINDSVARDEYLKANPSLKLVYTKNYNLDETFPTSSIENLKDYIDNDTSWIPQKKNGYTIHKEQKKVKTGNKETIKTVRVKEPKFKPVYKDVKGFFEPEIKEENGIKYLVCNFYGHDNK